MTPEQQAALRAARERLSKTQQSSQPSQLTATQRATLNAVRDRLARQRAAAPMTQMGESAGVIGGAVERPNVATMNPFAMSEAGIDVGTPASRRGTVRQVLQGLTLGAGEEAEAGLRALSPNVGYDEALKSIRSEMRAFEQAKPGAAAIAEGVGALMSPAALARLPQALRFGGTGTQAAAQAGVIGGAYGFAAGEGGVGERAEEALQVGIPSALFGAAAEKIAVPALDAATKRIFKKTEVAPSVSDLREAKNAAYAQVDSDRLIFAPNDLSELMQRASAQAARYDYVPGIDTALDAAKKIIERRQDAGLTLGQADNLRQSLFDRLGKASGGEKRAIGGIIDELDEMIDIKLAGDNSLQVARLANSRYKKAELLDQAFEAAKTQAAATGSGGNVQNLYRQAVNKILNSPNKVKFFSAEERQAMQDFVRGDFTQNVTRLIGKLSPSGNGLMMALNIGAVAADPAMLAATIAGGTSKAFADNRIQQQARQLVERMGTGRTMEDRLRATPLYPSIPSLLDAGE